MSTDKTQKAEDANGKQTYKVGDTIAVRPAGIVTSPDGASHIVIRGKFVLDRPGSFLVDGTEVTVQ